MISPATGMRTGERYAVESVERAPHFPGFFLDGKYYLGPELNTAVGWLEGQTFIYDQLDPEGEPVYPNRVAGTIEDLTLVMADGVRLQLTPLQPEIDRPAVGAGPSGQSKSSPLAEKLVVITGASSGIGRATAQAFARQRARLVLAARDRAALDEVVAECQAEGARALAVCTDVTSSEQMQALAAEAATFGDGRIDIWINNAGVGAVGDFEQTPLEAHEQVLQTDLLGYLRGAYVAWPYFKKQKRGILINTLSLGSWVAQPYAAAYSASKYGLRGLSEALRGELGEYRDIHVCDIYPAVMDTPGFRDGANFTGHALKPPPPVYDPHRVAEAMVSCALNPKPTTTVGSAAVLARAAHFLLPGFPQLSGWLTRWGLNRSPASDTSSGNLFAPPSGQRRVEGGWRKPARRPTPLLVAGAALLLGGCLVALGRERGRG
ncbi:MULTISPECIES: SDR family oxidoreductase [Pseudomonas]|uniref:SDR family oxidoreductase n=1 Tax=Pseudomonas TaxID=286 RepID=UPI0018E850F8|nr:MULTISPECIES: SDR family oxidoreductase [Pseudomonas]MBJ2347105.1 SDR family oxidoreductase [Pseudomonas canavaninivorans]MBL3542510.1 SDR family oxidoreductase [Pseudomonas sp. HB05]UVM70068.1 SDR family oxidoreductase [Pseudomonas canavaninivorans]